ncbi:MAG TPA: serine/threonine protein phosphatase [Desulfobulbaceae bacterium]|nr:serine/threonine protein phosphatase [Desulfobulbaceae bacterium]
MVDPLKKKLKPISSLQEVRGVQLPAGLSFVQLIVTGPPGAGKTYYINKIHGWPNEGYLDLTRKNWWKDRALTYRPREVHLGLPFSGYTEALTVFDKEWLEAPEPPQLEPERIKIPPVSNHIFQTNWRHRYVFEFLLPPAKTIFKRRQARSSEGYFPVDENLTMEIVEQQLTIYRQVVLHLHHQKMQVYVRKSLDKPPLYIAEKEDVGKPGWLSGHPFPRPSLATIDGWKWLLLRKLPINWFTVTDDWQRITKESRIAYDGKPLELRLGKQVLRFYPEIPLGIRKKNLKKNWLITDPSTFGSHLCGFARLRVGETAMIGRDNRKYKAIFNFPKNVGKRHVNISNERGDLIITPLDDQRPVEIIRFEDNDRKARIEARRYDALMHLKKLYGGPVEILPTAQAIATLTTVNRILEKEPYRPRDNSGLPGGLIELPSEKIPIIVGDLHAQVNNLLKILSENKFLEGIESESACLIILGDAVHSELPGEMEAMDSSVLIMDIILRLKQLFPANVFYLRGNHDSFAADICKNGICQGSLFKKRLIELRGDEYVRAMENFYNLLPYVIKSDRFVACHAGPPARKTSLKEIINLRSHPDIAQDIINSRLKRSNYFAGYGKADVKRFRKSLKLPKRAPCIVGHTPLDGTGSIWTNVGEIKNHHIVYSGRPEGPSLFVEINKRMIPLSYPAEPLINILGKMRQVE